MRPSLMGALSNKKKGKLMRSEVRIHLAGPLCLPRRLQYHVAFAATYTDMVKKCAHGPDVHSAGVVSCCNGPWQAAVRRKRAWGVMVTGGKDVRSAGSEGRFALLQGEGVACTQLMMHYTLGYVPGKKGLLRL